MNPDIATIKPALDAATELLNTGNLSALDVIIDALRNEGLDAQLDHVLISLDNDDIPVAQFEGHEWPPSSAVLVQQLANAGIGRSSDGRYFVPVYCPIILLAADCLDAHLSNLNLSVANDRDESLGVEIEWFDRLFLPAIGDEAAFECSLLDMEEVEIGTKDRETMDAPCADGKFADDCEGFGAVYARGVMRFDTFSVEVIGSCLFYGAPFSIPFRPDVTGEIELAIDKCPESWANLPLVGELAFHRHAPSRVANGIASLAAAEVLNSVANEHACRVHELVVQDAKVDADGEQGVEVVLAVRLPNGDSMNVTFHPFPHGFVLGALFNLSREQLLHGLIDESDARIVGFDDEDEDEGRFSAFALTMAEDVAEDLSRADPLECLLETLGSFLHSKNATIFHHAMEHMAELGESMPLDVVAECLSDIDPDVAGLLGLLAPSSLRFDGEGNICFPIMIPMTLVDTPNRTGPMLQHADHLGVEQAMTNEGSLEVSFLNHIYCLPGFVECVECDPSDFLATLHLLLCEDVPPDDMDDLCLSEAHYTSDDPDTEGHAHAFGLFGMVRAEGPSDELVQALTDPMSLNAEEWLQRPEVRHALDEFCNAAVAEGVQVYTHRPMPFDFGVSAALFLSGVVQAAVDFYAEVDQLPGSGQPQVIDFSLEDAGDPKSEVVMTLEVRKGENPTKILDVHLPPMPDNDQAELIVRHIFTSVGFEMVVH